MTSAANHSQSKAKAMRQLVRLRDEFVELASVGRFTDAASYEWRELPAYWRMALLLVAGVGVDLDDLDKLASRSWQEMPDPERQAIQWVVRSGKKHLGPLVALAAKV